MERKLLLLIPIVFLLAVLAFVIYWNPPQTAVSFKFDAVKIDMDGNELGNFTIELSGYKIEPYFEEPRLELDIAPFDNLRSLYTSYPNFKFKGAPIRKALNGSFQVIDCDAFVNGKDDPISMRIGFSSEYDRWALYNLDDEVCYVGSVSGDYTVQELYDYFKPPFTFKWNSE